MGLVSSSWILARLAVYPAVDRSYYCVREAHPLAAHSRNSPIVFVRYSEGNGSSALRSLGSTSTQYSVYFVHQ